MLWERRLGRNKVAQPVRSPTVLRCFAGPQADELAILCRPEGPAQDTAGQAEAAYRALAEQLDAHQTSFAEHAAETLFLRDIRRDLPPLLNARPRVLAGLSQMRTTFPCVSMP